MKSGRLAGISERWFRLLLRLYPADFRDDMGEGLVEAYRERAGEAMKAAGMSAVAGVWLEAMRDSLRNGVGERLRPAVAWRRGGDWGHDLERATRRIRSKPLFLVAVLGTLTVGLGTFAVVYTAVDKILLEPLPYRNPGDLYMVWEQSRTRSSTITGPVISGLQKAGAPIEAVAGMDTVSLTIPAGPDRDAMRFVGMSVSPNLFDLLGVRPVLGRGFRPEETGPNSPDVVVLTDAFWKRLGGNAAIVGTPLQIGTSSFTVIGVMPADFRFDGSFSVAPDVYVPLYVDLASQPPWIHDWRGLVRARHGASVDDVRRAVEAVSRVTDDQDQHQGNGRSLYPVGLQTDLVAGVRPALLALSFAVVFLVLVLTVNLASLLLARAAEREREFAVSRALGASGAAVVRATLMEGTLLGLAGGISGVVGGHWGTRMLVSLGPENLPRREAVVLGWSVALVVIAAGVLLGFLAACLPAVWAARVSLASLLSGASVRGSAGSGRMRRGLMVAQVALSIVLLSAGGLVVRSFERLLAADPGFRSQGVVVVNLGLGSWLFSKDSELTAFHNRLDEALRALPGVTDVSATTTVPLAGGTNVTTVRIPGAPVNAGDDEREIAIDRIFTRSGYVETMGMRLREGRGFEAVYRKGVREVIVDRQLAREFFGDSSPLGATLHCEKETMTIVGVVEQARMYSLHTDGRPQLFVRAEDYERRPSNYVIRTGGDPRALLSQIGAVIRQVDRRVPVSPPVLMDDIVAEYRSRERLSALLMSGLALGALLLVSMGLFGMISNSVTRRRGEIAVRLALGASRMGVIRLVVGEGARLIALGLLLGIPGMYMAGQALDGFLVGVSPFDAPTLAAVLIGLAVVALSACFLAARRASRIEPARLLREGG